MLRLWLLGAWRAEYDGLPLPHLPTRHARVLLARLALAHPRPVLREQLFLDLFPDAVPERAAHNLRTTLYYLRRALPSVIVSDDHAIGLDPSLRVEHDVASFEHASVAGATQRMLQAAVAHYAGPFLQAPTGWAAAEADRLRQRYIDVLQRLIALSTTSHQPAIAVEAARRWIDEEPWNEDAMEAALRSLIALGDRQGAASQLRVARSLADRSGTASFRTALDQFARAIARLPALPPPSCPLIDHSQGIRDGDLPLVGRDVEMRQLRDIWKDVQNGASRIATLVGTEGSGKSRLANELVALVRSQSDALVLVGRSSRYTPEHALGTFRAAFSHIAPTDARKLHQAMYSLNDHTWHVVGAFPEFRALHPRRSHAQPARLDGAAEVARRHAAFLALLDAITAQTPLMLVLEDTESLDPETFRLLDALEAHTRRMLVLRTTTVLDPETAHSASIPLGSLDDASVRAIVAATLDAPVAAAALDRIVAWSDGNPLRTRRTIRALIARRMLQRENDGWWLMPDASHHDLVEHPLHHDLAALSPAAQDAAHLLAILERPADLAFLERVTGTEGHPVLGAELLAHHIAVEDNGRLRIDHASTRAAILSGLGASDREMLHARIAAALRSLAHPDPAEVLFHEQGAQSWDHAFTTALDVADRAWNDYQLATMSRALAVADQALAEISTNLDDERHWRLLALKEQWASAADRGLHWERALNAMQRFANAHRRADWRIEAMFRHGRALREHGRLPEAEPLLRAAAEQAHRAGLALAEARTRTSLAAVLEDRGAVLDAVEEQQRAVAAARRADDPALYIHTRGVLAYMQMRIGNTEEAAALNQHVLASPILARLPVLGARFARHQGIIDIAARRYEEGLEWLRRSIKQSQEIGDQFGLLTGQTSLVYYESLLGMHDSSRALGAIVIVQARASKAHAHICWLLHALARCAMLQGDDASAFDLAQESADCGERIGDFDLASGSLALLALLALRKHRLVDAQMFGERAVGCAARVDHSTKIVAHIVARIWIASHDPVRARAYAMQAIHDARRSGLASVHAVEALFDAAHVLAHTDDAATSERVRDEAYLLFVDSLARMTSPALRRAYVGASAAHRALAASHGSGPRRIALLPARSAPRGRPLHDDEVIPVVWTIQHEDARIPRRDHVRRLTEEAAAQGAVATVEALAVALAVAPRTVQRDLHDLRRHGVSAETRGGHERMP